MDMSTVSLIGWFHTLVSLIALAAGAWVLAAVKGTRLHRRLGIVYVATLAIAGLTAFTIYHFDIQFFPPRFGPNIFGLFHWETVIILVFLISGYFSARRQNRAFFSYAHPAFMLLSYYMLVAAFVNELFARVVPLRQFALSQLQPGAAANVTQAPIAQWIQRLTLAGLLIMLVWFMTKVALRRRKSKGSEHL